MLILGTCNVSFIYHHSEHNSFVLKVTQQKTVKSLTRSSNSFSSYKVFGFIPRRYQPADPVYSTTSCPAHLPQAAAPTTTAAAATTTAAAAASPTTATDLIFAFRAARF